MKLKLNQLHQLYFLHYIELEPHSESAIIHLMLLHHGLVTKALFTEVAMHHI